VNQNINEREKELVESYDFAPFMPKHRASKRGASSKMKDQPIESKKEEGGEGNPGGGMVNERTSSESSCQIRRNSVVAPLASLSLGWVVIYADRLSLSPLLNLIKGEFRLCRSFSRSIYLLSYLRILHYPGHNLCWQIRLQGRNCFLSFSCCYIIWPSRDIRLFVLSLAFSNRDSWSGGRSLLSQRLYNLK
jgi:hypothetical protein